VAEQLGAVSLVLDVDDAALKAGLDRAQKLAAEAGNNISQRLAARQSVVGILEKQLGTLQAKLRSNPWDAATLEAPIKALEAEIALRKQSIALLEQQIKKQGQAARQPAGGGGAGLDAISGALGALPGAFGQVGSLAAGAGPAALAAATVAAGAAAVKAADDYQRLTQQLTLLTGSAEQTDAVLQELKAYAQATPFDLPGVAENAKLLLAFGLNAQQAVEFTKRLGDVATVTGTPLDRLSLNLGQIISLGKAYTVDLRQFATAGIPIYDTLSKVTGKSIEQLKQLDSIPADQVIAAFKAMTSEGGKFYEGGIKGGTALQTAWASLVDDATALGVQVGQIITPPVIGAIKSYSDAFKSATFQIKSAREALEKFGKTNVEPLANILPQGMKASFARISPEITKILRVALAAALPPGIDKLLFIGQSLPEPPPEPKKPIKPTPPKPDPLAKADPQLATAAAASEKRLNNLIQIQGLESSVLQIVTAQQKVQEAYTEQARLAAEYSKAESDARAAGKDPATVQAVVDAEQRLKAAGTNLRSTFIEGSQTAADILKGAAERFKAAGQALRGSLEGAFQFLRPDIQNKLTERARADISAAQKAGIFRGDVGLNSTPEELLSIAGSARSVLTATAEFNKAGTDLNSAIDQLSSPLLELSKKDWTVVVNVASSGLASVSGDAVLGG
jgi:hypothetical protein